MFVTYRTNNVRICILFSFLLFNFSFCVFAWFSFCLFPYLWACSKLISASVSVFSVFVSVYIFHLSVSITSLSLYQSVIYPCVFLCLCLCFYHVRVSALAAVDSVCNYILSLSLFFKYWSSKPIGRFETEYVKVSVPFVS